MSYNPFFKLFYRTLRFINNIVQFFLKYEISRHCSKYFKIFSRTIAVLKYKQNVLCHICVIIIFLNDTFLRCNMSNKLVSRKHANAFVEIFEFKIFVISGNFFINKK